MPTEGAVRFGMWQLLAGRELLGPAQLAQLAQLEWLARLVWLAEVAQLEQLAVSRSQPHGGAATKGISESHNQENKDCRLH